MHIHYEVDEHQHLHDDELATFSLRKRRSSTHTMYLVEKICTSPRTWHTKTYSSRRHVL
jgi:hypothetical protein